MVGTYYLTAEITYRSNAPVQQVQETTVVSANGSVITFQDVSGPLRSTASGTALTNQLTLMLSCPATTTKVFSYTASGQTLQLLDDPGLGRPATLRAFTLQ
jgi:hypothetical protein